MIGGKLSVPEFIVFWLLMMDFFPLLFGFGFLGAAAAGVFLRPS